MNPKRCATLPIFHALIGCDSVSSFVGRRKKTAWEIWEVFPGVTDAFEELLRMPSDVSEESMSLLERIVVLMYDRASDIREVNDARKQLFAHKPRALDNIPPTQAALQQHIKRASLQANCWNQTLVLNPELPSPSDKGGLWVAASLDDPARGIKIMPRTDPLQLQGEDVPAAASAPRLHSSALHYVHVRETVRCNQTP